MSRHPSYLLETPHGFYFRLRVPDDLRTVLGKRELKKALFEPNREVAYRKAMLYAARSHELFDLLRRPSLSKFPFIPKVLSINDLIWDGSSIKFERATCENDDDVRMLSQIINHIKTNTPQPAAQPQLNVSTDRLLSTQIDKYIHEQSDTLKRWKPAYTKEQRVLFGLFLKIVSDKDVTTICRDDARAFFEYLQNLPKNRNKNFNSNEKLSSTTVNLSMTKVAGLFKWLVREELISRDPFEGLRLNDKSKASEKSKVYTPEDLKMIFSDPVFIDKSGKHDYMYWAPLLSLYSGMRLNEICCLEKPNVYPVDDIHVMEITEDDDKSTKNIHSRRIVPIHSELIRLGFLEFVEHTKTNRLFPNLNKINDKYSHDVSNWYSRFRKKVGITDKGKHFHSFRHTVLNMFKQLQVPKEIAAAIAGHADSSETYGRYGKDYKPQILKETIEKLNFSLPEIKIWT